MKVSIDSQCDITLYIEEKDKINLTTKTISGQGISSYRQSRKAFVRVSLGIDDLFAKEHGNWRIGVQIRESEVDIRLSRSAYEELVRNNYVFAEPHAYRDGSKLTIIEATNKDYSLGYRILEDVLTF
jgi:hypothetical protein